MVEETKIANIKTMSKSVQEAETIRKMFFAMSEDIRAIIKLADKLYNMRTLHYLKDERTRNSHDTLTSTRLGDRLGISWMKDERGSQSEALKPDIQPHSRVLYRKSEQTAYLARWRNRYTGRVGTQTSPILSPAAPNTPTPST